MYIPSFMLNNNMAGLLITLAGQSILISLIGLTVLKALSRSSAPVRSLVCSATMIALGLILVISIGFYIKGISWSQATLPFVMEKNTENGIFISEKNTIALSQIRSLPLEARSQIPAEQNMEGPASHISPHPAPFVLPVFLLINITGIIWLAGILFQMVRLGYGIIIVNKFRSSLKSCRNDHYDKMLHDVAGRFWKKRLPKLYSSPLIKSPVTIGIFNPVVIIPQSLSSIITENEMKSILLHELAHIYHYDQVAGMVKRFVIAFHWWNPFVYIINKEHEQTREEVSDNYVLGELQPKVYSQCLMDLTKKVCLISSYPTAVGMAGRHLNLRKRVEEILSKKRRIAMGTKLHLKVTGLLISLILTFSIAGIHARVSEVKNDDAVRVLQEPQQAINPVSITKNIPEIKAVDDLEILNNVTAPQKELSGREVQENKEPVMVMASVNTKSINKTQKLMDSVSVQLSDKPALIKDIAVNKVLAQNETVEDFNLNSATVPDNVVQNFKPEVTANDSKKEGIDTAIADISRQIELNDSDARLYVLRGNLHMDKQAYGQAINDYTKAIEINPDDVTAYNNRGLAYANMGEYKQAIKDYSIAIKRAPENISAYINRGNAYYARNKYLKAISDYARAIEIDPEFSLAYINRGIAYHRRNSINNAIKDFSKAIELDNSDTGTYMLRGNAYYGKREYMQAINDYNRALEINPDSFDAYNYRGMAYEGMGESDKAMLDISKAIEKAPKYFEAYINRGSLYIKTNQPDKALSDFSKAKEINPDSFEAYNFNADTYSIAPFKGPDVYSRLSNLAGKEITALKSARSANGYYRNYLNACTNCSDADYSWLSNYKARLGY